MTAQKSVCASRGCFRLVQKSSAPDSGFGVAPAPGERASPRPGFCQIAGQSIETMPCKQRGLQTFNEGTVSLFHKISHMRFKVEMMEEQNFQ